MVRFFAFLMSLVLGACLRAETWTFDRLDRLGGHPTTILGHPRLIDTPAGKAIEFDGVQDALYVAVNPLAGAQSFTWEVIFRPDKGGALAQRFFHLQEQDEQTALDTPNRLLMEIRVLDERWCLDSYAHAGAGAKTLLNRESLYPLGLWYHAALVYDGKQLRNYVNGTLQESAEVQLAPLGTGHTSVGVRIDRRDYFKGAILVARMTSRALPVSEFLKVPARGPIASWTKGALHDGFWRTISRAYAFLPL
jgi:hypothetical protein